MKSHFSLTDLSIAVLMFAGTVAMHQAARAEDVFTGNLAPLAKKLMPVDVYNGPVAPVIEEFNGEENEAVEGEHHGKHGKNHGKHGKNGKNHGQHGKKGKHHDENEGLSTLEGPNHITIIF